MTVKLGRFLLYLVPVAVFSFLLYLGNVLHALRPVTLWENEPFHATAVAFVSCAAVLMCVVLLRRKREKERNQKLLHDRGERIKELQCIYGVAESIRSRTTLEEVFQDVADLIPSG
jgi:hypothetical protein